MLDEKSYENDIFKLKKNTITLWSKRNREYFTYIPRLQDMSRRIPLIIFLHGLIEETEHMKYNTQFLALARLSEEHKFAVAFPIGLKGAYSVFPSMLGWTPKFFKENLFFFKKMSNILCNKHLIDPNKIILAGFSNGAYFISDILQQGLGADLFAAYWLQGGGSPIPISKIVEKKKISLEAGKNDDGNLESIKKLKIHLEKTGWIRGKNLEFHLHEGGHSLCLINFKKTFSFLLYAN